MRGSPIWQTILMVLVFAVAGAPVWRLTRPAALAARTDAAAPLSTGTPARETPRSLQIEATFAPPPREFQIKYLEQTILEGRGPGASFTGRWSAVIPPEGIDLVVQADWDSPTPPATNDGVPPAAPSAARVVVRFDDGRQVEKSFWRTTKGPLAEVFTVPGAASAP